MFAFWPFLSGLTHFIFAMIMGKFMVRKYYELRWGWLLAFGIMMTIFEWSILLRSLIQMPEFFHTITIMAQFVAFFMLIEFSRTSLMNRGIRLNPAWVYIPPIIIAIAAFFYDKYLFFLFISIFFVVYSLAFPMAILWTLSKNFSRRRWLFYLIEGMLAFYGITFLVSTSSYETYATSLRNLFPNIVESGDWVYIVRAGSIYIIAFTIWIINSLSEKERSATTRKILGIRPNFTTAILLIAAMSLGWFFSDYFAHRSITELNEKYQKEASFFKMKVVDEMNLIQRSVKGVSGAYNLIRALQQPTPANLNSANNVLERYQQALGISVCYLMDKNGTTIASSNRDSPKSFVGKNYGFRPYFKKAIQGKPASYFAVGVTSGKRGFYASHPVFDLDGRIVGVVVMKADLSQLLEVVNGGKESVMILNPDGVVFLSNRPELQGKSLYPISNRIQSELIRSRQFGLHPFTSIFDEQIKNHSLQKLGNDNIIFVTVPINEEGWQIAVMGKVTELTIYQLFVLIITFLGVMAILVFMMVLEQTGEIAVNIAESEQQLRMLFESAPQMIFLVDMEDFRIVLFNQLAREWLGYEPQGLLHQNFGKLFQSNFEIFKKEVKEVSGDQVIRFSDYRFLKKNGMVMDVEGTGARIQWAGKELFIFFLRDVTDQKKIQKEIMENERKYRNLFDNASDAIILLSGGRIFDCNHKATEIFGVSREQLIQALPQDFLPEFQLNGSRSIDLFTDHMTKTLKGQSSRFSCQYLRGDHTPFDAEVSLNRVEVKGEIVVQAIIRDITEQKQLERKLKEARDKAIEASRTKSEFLANMSHEIRTPMNGVIGMLDLLSSTELTAEQKDFVDTAKVSAESLLTIINDILDFSKIEAGRLEIEETELDVHTVVETVGETLAKQAHEKNLEFICYTDKSVPANLKGDPVRLRQILINFANNAIKFTERGEVEVHCTLHRKAGNKVWLKFFVRDTGIGIPKDKQQKIFQAFEQADGSTTRKYGGTGLGLAISRQLIELMSGQLELESEPGKGSTFTFYIPFELGEKEKILPLELKQNLKRKRVLVIDDNATNRKILEQMLANFHMLSQSASSGREGLRKIKEAVDRKEPFHLVLLDVRMPEMDGKQVLLKLKEEGYLSFLKVVILSSSGSPAENRWYQRNGAAQFLYKPIKQARLLETIQQIFSEELRPVENKMENREKSVVETEETSTPLRKFKILLAEDNRINQKVAVRMLQNMGYAVDVANNGREALNMAFADHYDLVLMDVQMPEMDGIESTLAIRANENNNQHLTIIAMTAHAMKGDRERCLAAGMDDYLSKPIQKKELEAMLEKYLHSEQVAMTN